MLNIITALNSEAQPLIEHFSLMQQPAHHSMRIFADNGIRLVISGIGKAKSAAAVAYLAGMDNALASSLSNDDSPMQKAWINIGIAGHGDAAIGKCFVADKISNGHCGEIAYPSIPYATEIPSTSLCSVERPEINYPDDSLYDMEGYGFFSAAQSFSSVELIGLLKVVSDNKENSINQMNKAFVKGLIKDAIPEIEFTISVLRSLASQSASNNPQISWTDMWRTTHSQKLILSDMQHRLALLNKDINVTELVSKCQSAQEAIATMDEKLANTYLRLSTPS